MGYFFNCDCFSGLSQVPLYLLGEGYAANYVTSIANYNQPGKKLNIQGLIMIGALLDPQRVIRELGRFLQENQLISRGERMEVERQILLVRHLAMVGQLAESHEAYLQLNGYVRRVSQVNQFDIRLNTDYSDHDTLHTYFNNLTIKSTYNILPNIDYGKGEYYVRLQMQRVFMLDTTHYLSALLENQTKILVL